MPRRCGAPNRTCFDRMEKVASAARGRPEAKTRELIRWINDNLCPDRPHWNDRRVLIFTENVIGTKRYLREMLEQAIAGTDLADERIETIDGQTAGANRKEIQRRFNADPADDPLRILIATDAAREGLNFQAHCTGPVSLRPALESGPDRAAQRPHRPQAATGRRRSAATTSRSRSAPRTACWKCWSGRRRPSSASSAASPR